MTTYFSKMLLILLATAAALSLIQDVSGATTSSEEESSLEKCCELGSSWAQQKLRCEKFTGPVSGVAPSDQPACMEAVEICCRKIFMENECDQGKADARAGIECTRSDTGPRRTPVGLGDFRHDCCEGCKLGLRTSLKGKGCSFKRLILGAPWDSAFSDCCNEPITSSTQSITSTKVTYTSTSITTPETDELDYEDITDATYNTSSSVDLCKIMKGLLCSDICVPTPGSYICKCYEGSKLQEDGRSCVSKTTTTIATSTTPLKKTTKPQLIKSTTKLTTPLITKTTKQQQKITKRSTQTTTKLTTKKSLTTSKKFTKTTESIKTTKLPDKKSKSRTTRSASSEDNELTSTPCPNGFRFNPASEDCDEIDEGNAVTTIKPEDFRCELGYRWNSTTEQCEDEDECLENTHKCLVESETCRNLVGSYECEIKCEYGFVFDGNFGACLDLNECTELTNVCSQIDTICVNTLGGFECINVNEYQQPNYIGNETDDTRSNDYDGFEEDINECELELNQPACSPGEICRNTLGGYDCIPVGCPRGFNMENQKCLDVDECEQNLHTCASHELCKNTNGSFTCELPRPTRPPPIVEPPAISCRKGYKADNETKRCIDIDECVEGPGCRDHEVCKNLEGSYDCSPLCGPGWYFQFKTKSCEDVNECLLGHHNCKQRTHYCRNTNGSYSCEVLSPCPAGYRRNQEGNCLDIDECLESLHSCNRALHRYCVNLEGAYECITRLPPCARGFEYSMLSRRCEDIDECRTGQATCDVRLNQRCINLSGSYRCEGPPMPDLRSLLAKQRPACPTGFSYDPTLRQCSGKMTTKPVEDHKIVPTTEIHGV